MVSGVSCLATDGNRNMATIVVSTRLFPATPTDDAETEERLQLRQMCLAPWCSSRRQGERGLP